MGITDHGIVGCGYGCGCSQSFDTGEKNFCNNPKHIAKRCGCYNLGGNIINCTRHLILYYMVTPVVVLLLGTSALAAFFS